MAEIKDKKAMINNGDNIELDGVTVINKGISLSEVKKEEVAPVETKEEAVISSVSNEESAVEPQVSAPEISPTDIPFAPVDLPISAPVVPEMPIAQELANAKMVGFEQPVPSVPVYNYEPSASSNSDFLSSGVYKSSEDVDLAETAFLNDVKEAYIKNIVGPTKALVALVNDFKTWGNNVTSQGLNRTLFEEFDELSARYDGMEIAKYGDDKQENNIGGMNY